MNIYGIVSHRGTDRDHREIDLQDLPFPDRFYPDPEKPQKKLRALRGSIFFSEL